MFYEWAHTDSPTPPGQIEIIMKYKVTLCLIALFFTLGAVKTQAQNVAVKTNLIYDATATIKDQSQKYVSMHRSLQV